ncbi:MAG: hypothetical protein KAK00_03630 [Nanoarchaeota archaeon]|nr:hypothetical protein [Nanoarchaeota archaeon]
MEFEAKRLSPPNLRLIERSLKGNYIYNDNDVEVILRIATNSEEDTFEISLSARKKHSDFSFRIETRVAIEQHSTSGHKYPHLQINNFASDEELLKKGTLHIVLLVQSKKELEDCCNGFVYNIGEILDLIEKNFDIKKGLKEFFFHLKPFEELSKFSNNLHDLIYRSFKMNKLIFEKDEIDLVQFKGKKSEPAFDTKDIFKILRILLQLKFLNPVLLDPLLNLIMDDPQIKSTCSDLSIEECRKQLLNKSSSELLHYNRDVFMKEYSK